MVWVSGIALLALFCLQVPAPSNVGNSPGVSVQKFKWYKYRQNWDEKEPEVGPSEVYSRPDPRGRPMSDSTLPNKGLSPIERTVEDRSVDLGNVEAQATRDEHRHLRDGFVYEISIRNDADKAVRSFRLRYMPAKETAATVSSENPARRIVCEEKIGARSSKTFKIFSLLQPMGTISADSAARDRTQGSADEIVIDRIAFADGSEWNRSETDTEKAKTLSQSHRAPGTNCILY